MDINLKLNILDQIYEVYDQFTATLDTACQKYCDHCCTSGVILTTLEGYKIIDRLISANHKTVIDRIQTVPEIKRLRPQLTTNGLARLCARDADPPQEEDNLDLPACPLLEEHQCPIYELRPYGCRCLVSRHHCGDNGFAEIDDFVLSVNTVFLQTIEHVDAGGCSGNLVDVLQTMSDDEKRVAYESGALHCSANKLVVNQPLEVLMIPPEHRSAMKPILQELRQIKV